MCRKKHYSQGKLEVIKQKIISVGTTNCEYSSMTPKTEYWFKLTLALQEEEEVSASRSSPATTSTRISRSTKS